ncbi:MAG: SH3 domain-containing protein [Lachnospiraceae bacterium]|jgi:SH3 domain protein|nr:SH3 domain-containing protein [Lachnospiraceae bacterium]
MKNENTNNTWKDLLTDYRLYLAINVVLLIIIVVLLRGGDDTAKEEEVQQPPAQEETTGGAEQPEEAEPEPENNLEENNHASIDRLVEKYCESIASGDVEGLEEIVDLLTDEEKESIKNRAAFIESFDNVTCYTKNGPVEDSYIVFVCYDMKLINIETSAPDIICLYVGPKEDDGRRIHYGTIDESMQAYVAELEQDPEVQALYDDVRTRYQAAQESDGTLADFIQKISGQVAEEETETEEPEEGGEEPQEEEPEGEEPEASEEEESSGGVTVQNRETHVNSTVNVRSEQTTESERVALAYQGDAITQIESYENGWSKVEYKGLSGYVMTEYLE